MEPDMKIDIFDTTVPRTCIEAHFILSGCVEVMLSIDSSNWSLAYNEARAARQKQWPIWATFQSYTCFTINLYEIFMLLTGHLCLILAQILHQDPPCPNRHIL
uniref:Uncharacterized protein n=1 Tax=Arundo donax TaxID=35708 RepID=A0A0A9DVX3_ARUDO